MVPYHLLLDVNLHILYEYEHGIDLIQDTSTGIDVSQYNIIVKHEHSCGFLLPTFEWINTISKGLT